MRESQWSGQGWARVEALIEASRGEARAPMAALDADGTIWADDIGDDMLRWLCAEGLLLETGLGGFAEYQARVRADADLGYASVAQVMAGLAEAQVLAWARAFYEKHYAARVFAAQARLIDRLHAEGWEVWVVSASPYWMVAPGAGALGIPAERVLGVRVEVEAGLLTSRVVRPICSGAGKAPALEQAAGRRPWLAVGNSMGDAALLGSALHLAVTINPDPTLGALAQARGWLQESW
jgi:phosphoserine phosphatase